MGRPIKKKWFLDGNAKRILVNKAKWADGSDANADAYIVSQSGTNKYRVHSQTDGKTEILKLSNMDTLAGGEIRILATPYVTSGSGSPLRIAKIQQHIVTVWAVADDPNSQLIQYRWEDIEAPNDGVADELGEANIGIGPSTNPTAQGTTTISLSGGKIVSGEVVVEGRGYTPWAEVTVVAVPSGVPSPANINIVNTSFIAAGTGSIVGVIALANQLLAKLASLPPANLGEAYNDGAVTITVHNNTSLTDYQFNTEIVNGKLSTTIGSFSGVTGIIGVGDSLTITAITGETRPIPVEFTGRVSADANGVIPIGTPVSASGPGPVIAGAGYTVAPTFIVPAPAPAPAPAPF